MDDKPIATNRLSGLPRPTSRLPLPRSQPAPSAIPKPAPAGLRSAVSRENLSGPPGNGLRKTASNPRLRPAASRDQLRPPSSSSVAASTATFKRPPRPVGPPVSSRGALNGARARSVSREPATSRAASAASNETDDGRSRQSAPPRRRPSAQFASLLDPTESAVKEDVDEEAEEEAEAPDGLHSSTHSLGEAISFDATVAHPRKSTPSLSERTVETLTQLPSSPAFKRRTSNFYETEATTSRAGSGGSRPGSSYQSDGSSGPSARSLSRPGSSSGQIDGTYNRSRAPSSTYRPPLAALHGTPTKRTSTLLKTPTPAKHQPQPSASLSPGPRIPTPEKQLDISLPRYGSKPLAARPLKPRASLNNLSKKPSTSGLDKQPAGSVSRPPRKVAAASAKTSTTSPTLTVDSAKDATAKKSSSALREQIAQAKAAKRAAAEKEPGSKAPPPKSPLIPTDTSFDFGLSSDPFNQNQFEDSNGKVLQSRIETGRTTGRLNISAMGFKRLPDAILKMYDLESVGAANGSWAESVDLNRLVAAGNELEDIGDAFFPDTDPAAMADDEDSQGHLLGGLESLDLHGNMLISVPLGLRRLSLLTSLNLASNKLANNCLEVISQISCLRDLKLGNNLLYGAMDPCFSRLENLEILDLHGNEITSLPEGMENLSRLRMLNVNENALESLDFKALSRLPLTELLARKNKLTGTLIHPEVKSLPQLQVLDVSTNQLTLLASTDTPGALSLPSLHQLTLSMNRIKALPNIGSWMSLLSLNAEENSLTAIPDGFTSLETLRHVDFTSNDIKIIPPEISRMDALGMFRISGNPLKDRKLTAFTTEELKASLAAKLEPPPTEAKRVNSFGNGGSLLDAPKARRDSTQVDGDDHDDSRSEFDDFATPPTSAPQSPARVRSHTLSSQTWLIKAGGLLDRSDTQSSSLHPVTCSKIAVEQTIREVRLGHNTFTSLPNSLSFFADTLTSLSMPHNQLVGESFLAEELDLTALRELNLANNRITSLAPLTTHLRAPNLQKIDMSFNRVVSLPVLRDSFPSLTVLLISNNHLEALEPDSIRGLKVVDANNNDIAHLNPRLGLLGGAGNLERLDVSGNRFRVPRWNVLDRGTEATLRWLRGRVPVAEMAEWKAKAGNSADEDGSCNELD